MKVLVTGAAGFLGMHCAERLATRGDQVIGLDNLSPYYSVDLKEARLARLTVLKNFRFEHADLSAAGAAEVPGSGLGLAIVKRIAERHDATIELGPGFAGPAGEGLTVSVRFPVMGA